MDTIGEYLRHTPGPDRGKTHVDGMERCSECGEYTQVLPEVILSPQ
jgi:hypothetical protein